MRVTEMNAAPETLGQLLARMRPRLHRYCARMVGSAIDGEDVVQDALAKAVGAFPVEGGIDRPESWLFRVAHNAALDALRRRKRRVDGGSDVELEAVADPFAASDIRVAASASLQVLMRLPASQRASVILVDVLGHSLAETASILDISVAALKAAMHRGRLRLRELAGELIVVPAALPAAEQARLRDYADRFNAREFDVLRDLLADDVRLDLVNRLRLAGRKDVAVYFGRYGELSDWRLWPGTADGYPALLVSNPADPTDALTYVVLLDWRDGRISNIRDFRYGTYVMEDLTAKRL